MRATSGNVSARDGDRVAITPTGGVLARARPPSRSSSSIATGAVVEGTLAPTSEIALHLGVYERYGAGAVVHTHAPVATALSIVLDELPCVHYEMLAARRRRARGALPDVRHAGARRGRARRARGPLAPR